MPVISYKDLTKHLKNRGTDPFLPVYLIFGEELEVLERVNTFSLLPGTKVVVLRDSRIFYARQDKGRLLGNARQAYEDENLKKIQVNS